MIKPQFSLVRDERNPYYLYYFMDGETNYTDLFMANIGVHVVKYHYEDNKARYWALEEVNEAKIKELFKDMEEIYDIYLGTMPKSWSENIDEISSKFTKDWFYRYWQADNKYKAPDGWFKNKFNQLYFSPLEASNWNYEIKKILGKEIYLL